MTFSNRRSRWRSNLLAVGLSAALAFLTSEALVRRFTRYNTPDTVRAHSLTYEPAVYARHLLLPNMDIDSSLAWGPPETGEDDRLHYRTNRWGYRGNTFSVNDKRSTCRIIVIGGSAVFDIYASEGKDWPHLLELRLNDGTGFAVEVLNAGVPGHATADAVGRFYTQLWAYSPDMVLLYSTWNDIKLFAKLAPDQPLISLVRPYIASDDPFQNYRNWPDRFLSFSQIYTKLRTRYYLWKHRVGPEGSRQGRVLEDRFTSFAVAQYRLNVALFVDAVRNVGAVPVLLTEATLTSPDSSVEDRLRIEYEYAGLSHDALVAAFRAANEALAEVGRSKSVAVLDVGGRLSGRAELFRDHIHTNSEGSVVLARSVAEMLAPLLKSCPGASG